jgi:hypothetical protein
MCQDFLWCSSFSHSVYIFSRIKSVLSSVCIFCCSITSVRDLGYSRALGRWRTHTSTCFVLLQNNNA